MSDTNKRSRRLDAAVQAIQRKWGKQALHKGFQASVAPAHACQPTGLAQLDLLLQGGLPLGQITELIGPPTSGKRTLALTMVSQTQPRHPCLYIDLAQTFDPAYAAACHVDLARLIIAAPPDPLKALDLAVDLITSDLYGLIVFDSTAELLAAPFAPGAAAVALRRLRQALNDKQTALLVLTTTYFGDGDSPHNYPAGFDLRQAAALRLAVERKRWLKQGKINRGYEATVSVLHSRRIRPGGSAVVRITFNGVQIGNP